MCFLEKQKEKLRGVAGTVPFSFLPLAHSDVGQGRSRWSVAYSSSCVFLPFSSNHAVALAPNLHTATSILGGVACPLPVSHAVFYPPFPGASHPPPVPCAWLPGLPLPWPHPLHPSLAGATPDGGGSGGAHGGLFLFSKFVLVSLSKRHFQQ